MADVLQRQSSNEPAPAAALPPQPHDPSPSGIIFRLTNVVSTASVGRRLDLKTIVLRARNAEYNPQRFTAVVMRIRDPKATVSIFSTGKLVCTGAKSVEQSHLALRKVPTLLYSYKDFKVKNIMATVDVQFALRLESLSNALSDFASYEPELFSGLFYRMRQPKLTLGLFVTGKIIVAGAKVYY
ncbi:hypothetical protein L7F22_016011 [Adiantum nelumboides]|nr:hypothetical protein [Adiantum nelumboides]